MGPSFQWDLLNYGRIINNVRLQDATFQQLAVTYQQTVLQAEQQVEDGLVTFLRSQRQTKLLDESVTAADKAVKVAIAQYKVGEAQLQPLRPDRAEPGHATGRRPRSAGADCPRTDCGLLGIGRRVGDCLQQCPGRCAPVLACADFSDECILRVRQSPSLLRSRLPYRCRRCPVRSTTAQLRSVRFTHPTTPEPVAVPLPPVSTP